MNIFNRLSRWRGRKHNYSGSTTEFNPIHLVLWYENIITNGYGVSKWDNLQAAIMYNVAVIHGTWMWNTIFDSLDGGLIWLSVGCVYIDLVVRW